MKLFLKENYTIEDLQNENKIIYFDIDNTLGSRTGSDGYKDSEKFNKRKLKELNFFLKTNNLSPFDFSDFTSPEIHCLGMFMKLLKETNSKAICVSSWCITLQTRCTDDIDAIKLLDLIFKHVFEDWEEGLIVGLNSFSGDRADEAINFTKQHGLTNNYLVVDDAVGISYKETDKTINVDGILGFTYYNYKEAKDRLISRN